MREAHALAGKRVVVTRAAEQSGELTERLQAYGAEIVHLPAIAFAAPEDTRPLDATIQGLATFDWLLFTSQNAVRFFTCRWRQLSGDTEGPRGKMRVAAVGPATARAAEEAGWKVDFVAARYQGQALAEELGGELRGKRILLPRSHRAGRELPEALAMVGAAVAEVVAYRTQYAMAGNRGAIADQIRGADVVTFASPSAIAALVEAMGEAELRQASQSVPLAAIGPVTAGAIREIGLPVAIEAAEHTAAGLANSIAEYFRMQKVSSGALR